MQTRRHFIVSTAALAASAVFLQRQVFAATTLTLGNVQIDTLSDGNLVLPADFITAGMPQPETNAILATYGVTGNQMTPPCNVTLLRDGTNTVLFDLGAGPDFQPTAGKLSAAMEALGVSPDDVTHVVFTHGHPDHLWGLLDEFDEPVFANAEHMIGAAEFDYWMDPGTVETIGDARKTFAAGAARRLGVIAETVRRVNDGEEVLPGVAARLTPGHTPGHLSFEIRSGSTSVLVVGDAIGNHHVAFEKPDWATGSDQDPELAALTRTKLMDEIASSAIPLIGYHLPGSGIGHVERKGNAYRFVSM